ncbi:protein timeless isoform X2 [Periplaneta americana]|uniref:protein timeless isoform X2 n=1 Tax=Periplaneta americana TaxID=6978 RepID=UPI0037E82557
MEWMIVNSAQLHGMFASLGCQIGDKYNVSSDCLPILDEILGKLLLEDRTLRTFRRALGFSQVIKKDLLPLLTNVHEAKVIDATVKILVNLTIPVECLLPIDIMSKTDTGRHTIYELNQLLMSGKDAFVDSRSTRAVTDYMKRILDKECKLSQVECESLNNCLLLLRNILHIPESRILSPGGSLHCSKQNQILWNLFTQNVDRILIQLMTCSQKAYWGVTMVQLIALMYKDQHVGTLQKLLNLWFEASLSESSEDNESNTSPPDQGSGESSPMLTSDPTSDSSDTGSSSKDNRMHIHSNSKMDMDGGSGKQHVARISHADSNKTNGKNSNEVQRKNQAGPGASRKGNSGKSSSKKQSDVESGISSLHSQASTSHSHHQSRNWQSETTGSQKPDFPSSSEMSDCGYGTQMETQKSISTSSNEDEGPHAKRTSKHSHQKPLIMQKVRYNAQQNIILQDKKEWRRKKLVKRSRTSMNVKALLHHTPTDEDISNLLKKFTVDFLLKGYGCLVEDLHHQLLRSKQSVQIDTSHFFWLVTYFLKFAAQLELELDHIRPVLSFEIVSYLTFEGVNLCEQLELATQQQGSDLKPCLRRMHLVVTAIREFIQAVDTYKKITHLTREDREHLLELQLQIGATEDLKCLFVLLIRQYNPSIQNKQYLQDLIVTNHILLLFLDNVTKLPEYKGNTNLLEHIKQFATVEVMRQYGLLLEDFQNNGEFINDCVFTMMHHVGGDLEQASALFQPNILKAFSQIWEMDFEICDDWSDLIEYVIHKFINTPRVTSLTPESSSTGCERKESLATSGECEKPEAEWSKDDTNNLCWYYAQNSKSADPIGRVLDMFAENGVTHMTRIRIIQQLFKQDVISRSIYDGLMKLEMVKSEEGVNSCYKPADESKADMRPTVMDCSTTVAVGCTSILAGKIDSLRGDLIKEGKGKQILWLQKLLVEACYVKLICEKRLILKKMPTMEPVPHHYTLMKQSIPVVPWNLEQKNILSYEPFILLLHKLGFHLPADSGKIFVRIPNFWTADVLFNIAQKLGPIDTSSLKFDIALLSNSEENITCLEVGTLESSSQSNGIFAVPSSKQASSMIRFTPLPDSSPNWMQFVSQSKALPNTCTLPPPLTTQPSTSAPPPKSEVVTERCPSPTSGSLVLRADHPDVTVRAELESSQLAEADRHSVCSVCDTLADSVSSDLTRMCVSDEESPSMSVNMSSDSSVQEKDMSVT